MTTAIAGPHLRDLFDPDDLEMMLQDGYVRQQRHPTEALSILNYTEKTAYEGVWNAVTSACRGLIVEDGTGRVVARPFRKFFNHGQIGAPMIALDERAVATDKLDGSLGILYPTSDGWAVATRGSFASDQAIHATALYRDRYAGRWEPPAGFTFLFEIIYPQNRIVCDYADQDDLVLLGAINIATGRSMSAGSAAHWYSWPGPIAEEFRYRTLAEALAAPPRTGREGLVVHAVRTDERVKLKQADYVALHRIVTGLTARTVWQHLVDGKPLADLIEPLPDEFRPWVEKTAADLLAAVQREQWRLEDAYTAIRDRMPDSWNPHNRDGRKTFAVAVAGHADSWAMFAQLDQRDIQPELLKRARPEPGLTPSGRTHSEDTA